MFTYPSENSKNASQEEINDEDWTPEASSHTIQRSSQISSLSDENKYGWFLTDYKILVKKFRKMVRKGMLTSLEKCPRGVIIDGLNVMHTCVGSEWMFTKGHTMAIMALIQTFLLRGSGVVRVGFGWSHLRSAITLTGDLDRFRWTYLLRSGFIIDCPTFPAYSLTKSFPPAWKLYDDLAIADTAYRLGFAVCSADRYRDSRKNIKRSGLAMHAHWFRENHITLTDDRDTANAAVGRGFHHSRRPPAIGFSQEGRLTRACLILRDHRGQFLQPDAYEMPWDSFADLAFTQELKIRPEFADIGFDYMHDSKPVPAFGQPVPEPVAPAPPKLARTRREVRDDEIPVWNL